MKLCLRLVPFAALAVLLLTSTSCQRADAQSPVTISINYNGGNCTQSGPNGSSGVIDISASQNTVTYHSATAVNQFQISFGASCPYTSCPVNSSNGGDVTAQPAANAAGSSPPTTYNYSSVTFGTNQTCNNPQQLGVRVKP